MLADNELLKIVLLKLFINCKVRQTIFFESTRGRYDVFASIGAANHFNYLANELSAMSVEEFIEQLEFKTVYAKANSINPGKENGGLGTFNGLLSSAQSDYNKILKLNEGSLDSILSRIPLNDEKFDLDALESLYQECIEYQEFKENELSKVSWFFYDYEDESEDRSYQHVFAFVVTIIGLMFLSIMYQLIVSI